MTTAADQTPHPASPLDEATWAQLDAFLARLTEPVTLHLWADAAGSWLEQEASALLQQIADRYSAVTLYHFPRRDDYPFYPVIAVKGATDGADAATAVDYGIRLVGLPAGLQITALIGALQAASFKGQQLEPATRIRLHRLPVDVDIQLFTDANDEGGAMMSAMVFSLAAASPRIRTFCVMVDQFPDVARGNNVHQVPHLVFNEGVSLTGVVDEAGILDQLGYAVQLAQRS